MNRLRRRPADAGFTLIEMLTAIILSALVGSVLMSILLSTQRSVSATTTSDDVNAETRDAVNRMARDLRQAIPYSISGAQYPAITAVQNPDGAGHVAGGVTSITFVADFNGDGCIGGTSTDPLPDAAPGTSCSPAPAADPNNPETVTYCWGGTSDPHLYLIAGTVSSGCTPSSGTAQPLLSGSISAFELYYRSNNYRFDTNHDGITTWSELDAGGDKNGVLDPAELAHVNSVLITISATESTAQGGQHSQTYQTQVDLRNVP